MAPATTRNRWTLVATIPGVELHLHRCHGRQCGVARTPGQPPGDDRRRPVGVDDGFVFAFRVVMIGAASLALVAAAFGSAIRHHDVKASFAGEAGSMDA